MLGQSSESLTPPKGDIYTGSGDFIKQGKHHLHLLKKFANLQRNDQVLDVGSGIGRTAVALTKYINSSGSYEGFDVVKKGVDWCIKHITPEFPNFNFQYIPVHNDLYNQQSNKAKEYCFPYEDQKFDVVFLFSVFTHMLPEEIGHYLQEISRVLKIGGKCFATFFITPDDKVEYYQKTNKFSFPFTFSDHLLMDKKVKSANVCLHYSLLENLCKQAKLTIDYQSNGYWKDHVKENNENDFQDFVILSKS